MPYKLHRKAFSMLTAIIVLILMSTVGVLIMSISGKIVKETTAQFQREQSVLLAKSYTEYAILAVTANDRNTTTNCLRDIDGSIGTNPSNGDGYRIRVRIAYIGNIGEVGNCATTRIFSNSVVTVNTPLNIIIDTYVEYKDPDNTSGPWVTYHKRTLQKI